MKKQIFTMLTGLLIGASADRRLCRRSPPGIMAERSQPSCCRRRKRSADGSLCHQRQQLCEAPGHRQGCWISRSYWDSDANGCVQVESGKPYTGEAPAKAEPDKPESQPEATVPANDADVDAMKQDIVDRTNALRKENGVAAADVSTTSSCRRRRSGPMRWLRMRRLFSHKAGWAENSIPSRIVLTWPKISIASQIGCCLTRHLPNEQLRIGMPQRFIIRTWSIQSCQRSVSGWQEVSMILVTRAGTVSSFSSTMAIPSLGWIPPRTNKSSTLTQEQVVKICSFYCAFWKGERHEVN